MASSSISISKFCTDASSGKALDQAVCSGAVVVVVAEMREEEEDDDNDDDDT